MCTKLLGESLAMVMDMGCMCMFAYSNNIIGR